MIQSMAALEPGPKLTHFAHIWQRQSVDKFILKIPLLEYLVSALFGLEA